MAKRILISDFDGTMTSNDFFRLALARLPDDAVEPWLCFERGDCSHFDALAQIFARLRASIVEYDAMLESMMFDVDAATAIATLGRAGWQVVIASAGCSWYIERLLKRHCIAITVHANPGFVSPHGALIIQAAVTSPFYTADTGIDKSAVVRHYLAQGAEVAYAGDGRPDLTPALLVAPQHRFVTGWLAEELHRRGEQYRTFNAWHDIATLLTEEVEP